MRSTEVMRKTNRNMKQIKMHHPEDTWQDIVHLFDKHGGDQYTISEPITQLQHALQTYTIMTQLCASRPMHVAALLHDIGHLLSEPLDPVDGVDDRHERAGADWLAAREFSANVTEPVRMHVDAKRYLCGIDPTYKASLSRGSTLSLELQGGPMTPLECRLWSRNVWARDALVLRRCDDEGKDVSLTDLPTLASLKGVVLDVLTTKFD